MLRIVGALNDRRVQAAVGVAQKEGHHSGASLAYHIVTVSSPLGLAREYYQASLGTKLPSFASQ
jgi:hypothetical protein